jgi:hypothetical protein
MPSLVDTDWSGYEPCLSLWPPHRALMLKGILTEARMSVRNGRRNALALCAAIICASATGIACAQSPLCNAVLDAKAFNIYDSRTASDFQNATFDQMCRTEWTSITEYESTAKSLGSGGQYGVISGFLNLDRTDVSNSLRQAYDHLCVRKDQFLRDRLSSQSHIQIADAALSAWSACMQSTAAGLYSALVLPPDGNTFSIRVHFRGIGPGEKLTLKGFRTDAGYNCKYVNNDITDFTPQDHGLTDTDFDLSCVRTSRSHVQVSIGTNKTSIGLFDVPSEEFINLTRMVNVLQSTNDQLNRQLDELSKFEVTDPLLITNKDNMKIITARFCATTTVGGAINGAYCEARLDKQNRKQWTLKVLDPQGTLNCYITCIK